MPTARIPLVGTFNERSIDGTASLNVPEDQRFLNCTFNIVTNPITGKSVAYVEKRPGWGVDSTVSSGLAATGLIKPQGFNAVLSAFGETNSAVYWGTTKIGDITGRALHFTETIISASTYVALKSSDGTGWYYPNGAKDTLSYTGHTSSGSATVSTIANTAGLFSGQLITGNTIGAGARVSTVNSTTSTIVLTVNSNSTSTATALTKEPIAKIISANFVASATYQSGFIEMDGYLFYAVDTGTVRNSDLNTVEVYTSTRFVSPNMAPDQPVAVARHKNAIIAFGLASKEAFYNAGLASGSPLQRIPQFFDRIGTLDQRSVTTIENEIYFVSTPYEGDIGVYRIRDLQAQKISTPQIDRIIGTFATSGSIYANSFRMSGYPYLGLVLATSQDGPASNLLLESGDALLLEDGDNILMEDLPAQTASFNRYLIYNTQLNIWSEWDCNQATFIDSVGSGTNNQIVAASRFNTSGKVYTINPVSQGALYQDDGVNYSTQIRTSRVDFGTAKTKFIPEIRLVADRQSTGVVTLEYSDDDYSTWTNAGDFDLTSMEPKLTRLGSFNGGRAWRLTHSSNAYFRAEALEIDYEVGTR